MFGSNVNPTTTKNTWLAWSVIEAIPLMKLGVISEQKHHFGNDNDFGNMSMFFQVHLQAKIKIKNCKLKIKICKLKIKKVKKEWYKSKSYATEIMPW